jgi:hypothetical protein
MIVLIIQIPQLGSHPQVTIVNRATIDDNEMIVSYYRYEDHNILRMFLLVGSINPDNAHNAWLVPRVKFEISSERVSIFLDAYPDRDKFEVINELTGHYNVACSWVNTNYMTPEPAQGTFDESGDRSMNMKMKLVIPSNYFRDSVQHQIRQTGSFLLVERLGDDGQMEYEALSVR